MNAIETAREDDDRDNAGVGAGDPTSAPGRSDDRLGMAESSPESDPTGAAEPPSGIGAGSTVLELQRAAFRTNLWPPLNIERGQYRALTYPGHTPYAIDINRGWGTTDLGDEVLASAAGDVLSIDPAYGSVWIAHPFGISTLYAHLQGIAVRVGQHVVSAQLIGLIGRTAPQPAILSPHLHYQQLQFGYAVPVQFYGRTYPASVKTAAGLFYGPAFTGHRSPVR